jgi:hypothetical protein
LWQNHFVVSGSETLASAVANVEISRGTIIHALTNYCSSSHFLPHEVGLAYFFFTFRDGQKQLARNMLASIVSQLCRQAHPDFIPPQVFQPSEAWSEDSLLATIKSLATKFKLVYIILDALDESDREPTLNAIQSLAQPQLSDLNIIITSRREPDIAETLGEITPRRTVDIQASIVDSDIRAFVSESLQTANFKSLSVDLRKEIEEKLTNGARGMWVLSVLGNLLYSD